METPNTTELNHYFRIFHYFDKEKEWIRKTYAGLTKSEAQAIISEQQERGETPHPMLVALCKYEGYNGVTLKHAIKNMLCYCPDGELYVRKKVDSDLSHMDCNHLYYLKDFINYEKLTPAYFSEYNLVHIDGFIFSAYNPYGDKY